MASIPTHDLRTVSGADSVGHEFPRIDLASTDPPLPPMDEPEQGRRGAAARCDGGRA